MYTGVRLHVCSRVRECLCACMCLCVCTQKTSLRSYYLTTRLVLGELSIKEKRVSRYNHNIISIVATILT